MLAVTSNCQFAAQHDSVSVLNQLLEELHSYSDNGVEEKRYSFQVDSCFRKFTIYCDSRATKQEFHGSLNDLDSDMFQINGNSLSCGLTITGDYHRPKFKSSSNIAHDWMDEEIITHFIYLGEFDIAEMQKLVRIRSILDFFVSQTTHFLTPSFFKQDSSHLIINRKEVYSFNKQNQEYVLDEAIEFKHKIRFYDSSIQFEQDQIFQISKPHKDPEADLIVFSTTDDKIPLILFHLNGKFVTLIASDLKIIYFTSFSEKPCPNN